MNRLRSIFTLFALTACVSTAHAEHWVSLHIDQPNSNGDVVWLSESGWGLTLKMVIDNDDMLGIARYNNWPNKGGFGFIVFEDPDGCPWMDDSDWRDIGLPPAGCEEKDLDTLESDETYLEFRPDVDESGMPDSDGDADVLAQLVDSAGSGGPEFQKDFAADLCVPGTDDEDCYTFGPPTGGEETDGWGYGTDDNLPGLFLYMESGTGLLYDEPAFERSVPLGVRNLAGMINSVTYDLSDLSKTNSKEKGQRGKPTVTYHAETRVWAHMNVPDQLVRNILQYDACTGEPIYDDPPTNTQFSACSGDDLWRIDGGPVEVAPENYSRADAASIALLEDSVFTLKAFLVSGHAPDALVDVNGDGDFTDDAANAGYTVISNVDSIDVVQLSDVLCWGGGGSAVWADLDGNGEAVVPIVCPTGPGDITQPPR